MIHSLSSRLSSTFNKIGPRGRLWTLVIVLLLINIAILFPTLGYPRDIVFDETYLVPRAQAYKTGTYFQESHPPLGRLVIPLGQAIVNPDETFSKFATVEKIREEWPQNVDLAGYRLVPAIFGAINPVLAFGIVLLITSNTWIAFFAGLLLCFDNALVTQSRYAMSDSTLFLACLATLLCFTWLQTRESKPGRKERIVYALLGAFASAAFMVKFTGLFVLAAIPFYVFKLWKEGYKRELIPFFGITGISFVAVFIAIWHIHFSLINVYPKIPEEPRSERIQQSLDEPHRPNLIEVFIDELQVSYEYIFSYHGNVPDLDLSDPEEIGSPWYYWPFGGRAVPYRWYRHSNGTIQIIYLMGNPLTWLLSLLGVIGGTATLIANGLYRFMKPKRILWLGIFTFLYWFYMLNIARLSRVLYLYHYILPMIMGVILFSILFAQIEIIPQKAKRIIMVILMICVVAVFFVYFPFSNYQPLTFEQFAQRDVWPAWGLECPGCE